MDEKKEVIEQGKGNLLLEMAIQKDLDTEKLEKLIQLKNTEEERLCRKDFESNFTLMQAEYIPVQKSKEVWNKAGTSVLYKFCPLENILKVYAQIIAKHGFSFRWEEEMLENKDKRVRCIVSGYGYEKSSFVDIPIPEATSFTNSIQQRGVATTYGKRYSFINSFGVIIEEEDIDAAGLTAEAEKKADEDPAADIKKQILDMVKANTKYVTQPLQDKITKAFQEKHKPEYYTDKVLPTLKEEIATSKEFDKAPTVEAII